MLLWLRSSSMRRCWKPLQGLRIRAVTIRQMSMPVTPNGSVKWNWKPNVPSRIRLLPFRKRAMNVNERRRNLPSSVRRSVSKPRKPNTCVYTTNWKKPGTRLIRRRSRRLLQAMICRWSMLLPCMITRSLPSMQGKRSRLMIISQTFWVSIRTMPLAELRSRRNTRLILMN